MDESAAFLAALDRQSAINEANDAHQLYFRTLDGRYFWQAFLALHKIGEPMPPSIEKKFAEIARKLLCAETDDEVLVALEFKGHKKNHVGSAISHRVERRWRLVSMVDQVKNLYKIGIGEAIAVVAQNSHLSIANVKRIYYQMQVSPVSPSDTSPKPRRLRKKPQVEKWNNQTWGNRPKY